MNNSAEICRIAIERPRVRAEDIADEIGISTRNCDALLSRLCGQGVLARQGDVVTVADAERAQVIADGEEVKPVNGKAAVTPIAKGGWRPPKDPPPPPSKPAIPVFAETRAEPKAKPARVDIPVPDKIEIRKGVPLPPGRTARRDRPWPFAKMEAGDSFVVPVPAGAVARDMLKRLSQDGARFRKQHQAYRFRVRVLDNGAAVGVWRVET